jgi:hypothetical protein
MKIIYIFKQALCFWFRNIVANLRSFDLVPSDLDQNVYISNDRKTILLLYDGDMLIASGNTSQLSEVKQLLQNKYKMSDLGLVKQFPRIYIKQLSGFIQLSSSQA